MPKRFWGRVLLVCGGIALAVIVAEALVTVGYWAVFGRRFPLDKSQAAMLAVMAASGARPTSGRAGEDPRGVPTVIHPYLGFVPAPGQPDAPTIGDARQVPPKSDMERVVGVLGGSFAAGVCAFGENELHRALSLPGKDARVLCLAAGGYKQPQQLLALTYLLAQGAHFDLVLNIDGFNEVALPAVENRPQGVAPIYPRGWFWHVGNLEDPAALKLLGELSLNDGERKRWAATFLSWGLSHSTLLTLAWQSRDRLFAVERDRLLTELRDHKMEQRSSYAATGPPMTFADDQAYYGYLARIWKDASLQMQRLCDANGIAYAHFLQPNQYVAGSKPMTPDELRLIANPSFYGTPVQLGYPELRRQGEALAQAGVRFHDLTMVFAGVRDRLYDDGCCHLNGDGYRNIARAIGDALRNDEHGAPQTGTTQ